MRAVEETMSAAATAALASLAARPYTSNEQQAADAGVLLLRLQADEATAAADARAAQYRADAQQLYAYVGRRMDSATARVLQVCHQS